MLRRRRPALSGYPDVPIQDTEDEFHSCEEDLENKGKQDLFNLPERRHIEETWTCILCKAW